ncbi:hypothetical protein GCM10008083_07000 [Ulvibacter litoralis]|nr:hypothetical protein GCM10008083_07000 [Ulvibacter litoralis]
MCIIINIKFSYFYKLCSYSVKKIIGRKANILRQIYFPKKTENRISHVRPHTRNADDTYKLPLTDKLTGVKEYTKHCFWLNASYIRDEIYLK